MTFSRSRESLAAERPHTTRMRGEELPRSLANVGELAQFGFVAQLCLAAADVGQALQRAVQFCPLWSRVPIGCTRDERALTLRVASEQYTDEGLLCFVLSWSRLASRVAATEVAPVDVAVPDALRAALQPWLDCPVHGDEREVVLRFDAADLQRENPDADAQLLALLSRYAEQRLSEGALVASTAERVRTLLSRHDAPETARAERIARALGVGVRTLHRRLRAEDTSFRKLLAEHRMERCASELRFVSTSAKQLSYALGFADPASFHRAFKRWTGSTVSEYRQRTRQDDAEERGEP